MKLNEFFAEGNCGAFDDRLEITILLMLQIYRISSLATQQKSYKESAHRGKFGETPQDWLTNLS